MNNDQNETNQMGHKVYTTESKQNIKLTQKCEKNLQQKTNSIKLLQKKVNVYLSITDKYTTDKNFSESYPISSSSTSL